jgi:hypothetical protein
MLGSVTQGSPMSASSAPDEIRDAAAAMVAHDWLHYPDSPIPHPIDDAAQIVVRAFVSVTDAEQRAVILGLLWGEHVYVLQNFGVRMASLAVRRRSVDTLRTGLQAMALAGSSPTSDWRDLGIMLLPLTDAARRLGAGKDIFDAAARLAHSRTAELIRDAAPKRTLLSLLERLVAPFVKGPWTTADDAHGFRYVSSDRSPEQAKAIVQAITEARRVAVSRFRFRVSVILAIPQRGVAVAGEILDGAIGIGAIVRAAHLDPPMEWRVTGVEFLDSPSVRKYEIALMISDARPLDELRRLLPPGSVLDGVLAEP